MRVLNQVILLLCVAAGGIANVSLPQVLPAVIAESCTSAEAQETLRNGIVNQVDSIVSNIVANQPPCPCNIPGLWTRIAHLNMSAPDEECPPSWVNTTQPVRSCTRSTTAGAATDSAIFPANGQSYSHVCGRINAFQKGIPDAFFAGNNLGVNLEGAYVDGVSLTHGQPGSRQHIWTFVAASGVNANHSCSCLNNASSAVQAVPGFVGSNYFCASGHTGLLGQDQFYLSDPLWDGEGCDSTSNSCCQLNNPPYFCTELPQPTTDDIEVRICHNEPTYDEDTLVSLIDIYVL